MLKWLALTGLTPQQKIVLRKLAKKQKSLLRIMGEGFSGDEDYIRANMMSPVFGAEVLKQQVENERKEKNEIQQLIKDCKSVGISKWRINLVTSEVVDE